MSVHLDHARIEQYVMKVLEQCFVNVNQDTEATSVNDVSPLN